MPDFLYIYHGGSTPSSPEEGEKVMAAWMAWFGQLGDAVVNGGNPVGMSQTVSSKGVAGNGGANPAAGYSIVSASDIGTATTMAQGCPILSVGGTVEVAEIIPM